MKGPLIVLFIVFAVGGIIKAGRKVDYMLQVLFYFNVSDRLDIASCKACTTLFYI